jgi:hypothetical protein
VVFRFGFHGAGEAVHGGVVQGDGLGGEHGLDGGLGVERFEQGGGRFGVLGAIAGEGAGDAGEDGGGEHVGDASGNG